MTSEFAISTLLILGFASFFTSVVSGSIGMAGGIMLLSIMAAYFPPTELIPLHGIVQLSSNSSRAIYYFRFIDRRITLAFAVGSILGALVGANVVVSLPERELAITIALFILLVTWLPKLPAAPKIPYKFFWIGMVASFFSLFVGAVGLMVGPFFLRESITKQSVIASQAACQIILHLGKVLVFASLGFTIGKHAVLLGIMCGAALMGNLVGKVLMERISESAFRWLFRATCTVLALRMLFLQLQTL